VLAVYIPPHRKVRDGWGTRASVLVRRQVTAIRKDSGRNDLAVYWAPPAMEGMSMISSPSWKA
jgi:hypothetical protein